MTSLAVPSDAELSRLAAIKPPSNDDENEMVIAKKTHETAQKFFLSIIPLAAFVLFSGYNLYSAQIISQLAFRVIVIISGTNAYLGVTAFIALKFLFTYSSFKAVFFANNDVLYLDDVREAKAFYQKRIHGDVDCQRPSSLEGCPPIGLSNAGTNCWIDAFWQLLMRDHYLVDRLMNVDLSKIKDEDKKNSLFILQQSIIEYEKAQLEKKTSIDNTLACRIRRMIAYSYIKQRQRTRTANPIETYLIGHSSSHEDTTEVLGFIYACLPTQGEIQWRTYFAVAEGMAVPQEAVHVEGREYYVAQEEEEDNGFILLHLSDEPQQSFQSLWENLDKGECETISLPAFPEHDSSDSYQITRRERKYTQAPDVLYLMLNRVKTHFEGNTLVSIQKNNAEVQEIPYVKIIELEDSTRVTYRLQSFSTHSGGTSFGHYVSHVEKEGVHYLCDDAGVQEEGNIRSDEEKRAFSATAASSYLLQYVRVFD